MNLRNFSTLDLNLLRVFDEVMAERNLTRAANNLAMTQPAVSNALRRLREALGDDLVRRSGYGVEPTPLALAIWPKVRDALQQLRETLAPGGFDPAQAHNAFIIAMADATAAKIVPGLVHIFEHEAPGVNLRVLPLTTRDPRDLLESGSADLAIGHFPGVVAELTAVHLQETSPRFHFQRLYDGEYVVVMRRGHPLAGKPLDLDSYCAARHMLVSFSGRPFGFVDEALAALSRQRRVVLTVNQFFTAGRVVSTTDLLTVLPRHFVGATGMEHELAISELPLSVPAVHVDSLWHRQAMHNPAHRWLREAVVRASAQGFDSP
ncbi:LysR family transcriptional regulator [Hydrogenophaga sp.]|uniref:LysR family transcriptional regulator n=1 Tax=Hydrogenophaga sp. TaxID=1904254 RepID=UPI0035B0089F